MDSFLRSPGAQVIRLPVEVITDATLDEEPFVLDAASFRVQTHHARNTIRSARIMGSRREIRPSDACAQVGGRCGVSNE